MTRVFAGWGVLMGVILAVGVLFYHFASATNPSLFGWCVVAMLAIALVLLATGWGRNAVAEPRALPDVSPPTALLGIAIVTACVGAVFGFWLVLIGAGLGVAALGGLVREGRAQRAALRAAVAPRTSPQPPAMRRHATREARR